MEDILNKIIYFWELIEEILIPYYNKIMSKPSKNRIPRIESVSVYILMNAKDKIIRNKRVTNRKHI